MLLLFLKALLGLLFLTAASLATGSWLSNSLSDRFTKLDRIAVGLLAGFGLFSLVLFLVGQWAFTTKSIVIAICIAIVASARSLLNPIRDGLALVKDLSQAPKIPLVIVGAVLLFTGVAGLGEITGDWNSDTVAYHVLGPKVWLRNGVIRPVPDNCHTAFPQTAETMFGALFAIGGPRAPGFSSVVTFGMLLLIASSLARRSGLAAREAWWVAAIVATMPAIYTGSVGCFVDGIYAAFVLAALRIGADAEKTLDWATFGILCGLAMGTKYTGILAFPILVFCVLWIRIRLGSVSWRNYSKAMMVAISVACIVASPYYLRNWILLGCPIYPPPPGLAHLCSPKYLSPEVVSQFHSYIRQRGAGLGRGVIAFGLLPFNLTYHTSNFHGAGGIGLFPLALGPIGLVAARKEVLIKALAFTGFLLLTVWFVTQQESRFLIHVYILAVIVGVVGWQDVESRGKYAARLLAGTVLAISICYGLLMMGTAWAGSVKIALMPSFAERVRSTNIPYWESFQFLNNSHEVKRVLILDRSVMPFYSDKDYIKPVGQWGERTLPGALTSEQALQRAHQLQVSHVLDVNSEIAGFQVVGSTGLTLVFESKNQRVYRVN